MKFFHTFQVPRFRLLCLLCSTVVAVLLGFILFDVDQVVEFVGRLGYWFVAIPFGLLCLECVTYLRCRCVQQFGSDWPQKLLSIARFRVMISRFGPSSVFILFVAGLLLASQPIRFKVVMDEPVIATTAMQMHQEKQAYAVVQAYEIEGVTYAVGKIVDKRPLFFPFLLSLMHDFTGYRPMQGFYLNAVILVGFLGLIFHFGSRLCAPYGGYLGVGLVATVPLVVVNATSSGFDLLNIFMILALGGRLDAYLRKPDAVRLNLLLLVTVLLAQTRYESVLFIAPVVMVIFYVWIREKEVSITNTMIFVPLMLIVFALQRRMMNEFETFWQLPEGLEHPFGARFLGENLQIAFNFFFHSNETTPNSVLLSVFVIVAIVLLAWSALKRRCVLHTPGVYFMSWFGLVVVVVCNFMLLMAYHWGRIDDPVATRLALPILLVECLVVLWALGVASPERKWQLAIGAVILAYFVCFTRPLYARTDFFEWNVHGAECDYLLEISEKLNGSDRSLIISERGIVPAMTRTSCVPMRVALDNYDKLDLHMRLHTFDEVYVVYFVKSQGARVPNAYFAAVHEWQRELESRFEMETLDEIKINDAMHIRLARVERVRIEAGAMLDIDTHGIGVGVDGELIDPDQSLADAFVESLPR